MVTAGSAFAAGVWIGRTGSRALGPNAEIIGGLILIVIGAKVLIDHNAFG
jgi:putative Mn2+ efflux pump MntP